MESIPIILQDTNDKVSNLVKKKDKILLKDPKIYETTKLLSKVLYDTGKFFEVVSDSRTLPELIINGFDAEQVWAGIELQNKHKFDKFETKFSLVNIHALSQCSLLLGKPSKQPTKDDQIVPEIESESDPEEENYDIPENVDKNETEDQEETDSLKEEHDDLLDDPDFQNMSDSDGDDLPLFDDLDEDEMDEGEGEGTFKERERSTSKKKTVVDDEFFKLSDMEKFLESEDKKFEMRGKEEPEEDFLDLFEDMTEDDDKRVMYTDYFDKDESSHEADGSESDEEESNDENEMSDMETESSGLTGGKKSLLPSSDEEDEAEPKSTHEIAKERLKKKISHLEEAAVGEKPWQMGGEVAAPVRPENSLLAEHLDYDSAVRHAPVMTEDVAKTLDSIIKQRVKDKSWDDVERKVKPVEDPKEYRKKLVLDQEKSKVSLSQVYEDEYLKLAENAAPKEKSSVNVLDKEDEEVPIEYTEIKEMMNSLFRKMDTLTHLHYTPKSKSAELKVVRNIPSLAMEEVAPVSASNASLLAPDEVIEKEKGELVANEEKTETDKNRDRREKKAAKRAAKKERERKEALVEKLNPGLGNKYSKEKALKKIDADEKQGKLVRIKESKNSEVKSSTAFFNNLQDEVKTHVETKAKEKKKSKIKRDVNFTNLKL